MAYGVCLYLVILIWRDSLSDSITGFSPLSLNTCSWGSGCYSSSQAHLCSHNYFMGDHSLGCSPRRSSCLTHENIGFQQFINSGYWETPCPWALMVRVWWDSSHQDTSFAMCFWWWISKQFQMIQPWNVLWKMVRKVDSASEQVFDQVWFIAGMQEWFNICKPINAIHHYQFKKWKSHDHLDWCRENIWWTFIIKTLNKIGVEIARGYSLTIGYDCWGQPSLEASEKLPDWR